MRVLLLNPSRLEGVSYTILPNIGLGHLAHVLRAHGHEVVICDANRDGFSDKEFAHIVAKNRPHLVGITVFSPFLEAARRFAKAALSARANLKVVFGGPHPTFEPGQTLDLAPEADFVIVGEGEPTLPSLCRHIEDGSIAPSQIPNLAYRFNDQVIENPRCFVKDLDELGPPAWDLLRPDLFPLAPNGIFSKANKVAPIIATRGCPYPCTFCGAGVSMGKKIRTRSASSIRDEMELLHSRYGIGEIHFMDDNFTQNRDFVAELCELLIKKGPHMPWACPNGVRIDRIDDELARLMERAGCYSLALGIEFGTDRMLKEIRKKLTISQIEKQVRMIRENTDMRLTGFFILGHPQEVESDIAKTVDFSLRLPLDRANYFNFTPFPGSELYDALKAQGALYGVSLEDMYIHNVAYHPPGITAKRLAQLQRNAHIKFYLRPKILLGLLREIRGFAQIRILLTRATHLLIGK